MKRILVLSQRDDEEDEEKEKEKDEVQGKIGKHVVITYMHIVVHPTRYSYYGDRVADVNPSNNNYKQ